MEKYIDIDIEIDNHENYAEALGHLKDLYNSVQKRLNKAYEKNTRSYNLRKRETEFFVGDKVWKKNKVLSDAAQSFAQKVAPRYELCIVNKKIV